MKTSTKIIALGAACAACCALPVAGSLLAGVFAGSALPSLGLGTVEWIVENACGCSGSTIIAELVETAKHAPIACTLTPCDFKERVNWIRDLACESLLHVRREPLALHLIYDTSAADRVREMVRKEEACCEFLRFDLREAANGIHLTITAPEEAREAANELFAHFTPELARSEVPPSRMQRESV